VAWRSRARAWEGTPEEQQRRPGARARERRKEKEERREKKRKEKKENREKENKERKREKEKKKVKEKREENFGKNREIRKRIFCGVSRFSGAGVISGTTVMARRAGRRDRGKLGIPGEVADSGAVAARGERRWPK
jgi:hypothetical protein